MTTTSLERLLAQAEQICLQRNVRLTPQRMEVLRLMACQKGTISAYDLLDLLRVSEPQTKTADYLPSIGFSVGAGFHSQSGID